MAQLDLPRTFTVSLVADNSEALFGLILDTAQNVGKPEHIADFRIDETNNNTQIEWASSPEDADFVASYRQYQRKVASKSALRLPMTVH